MSRFACAVVLPKAEHKKFKTQLVAGVCAVPAAFSLGVALSSPAQAQTVINTNQSSTVDLSNYGGVNNFSITAGTTIGVASGIGLYGDAASGWTLSNAGSILAPAGTGILLRGLGDITNTGAVTGGQAGIQLDAGGTVYNTGSIGGTRYGVVANNSAASVSNGGDITAQYDGISLNHGGSVVNNAGGTIFGTHIGLYTGHSLGFVENAGFIGSATGDAVSLYHGGTFSNAASGVVHGGYSGVYTGGSGAVVQNAGIIAGSRAGVYLDGASSLTNSGTITGVAFGVLEVAAGGSLTNSGLISATHTGLELYRASALDNAGTIAGGITGLNLPHGGIVTNEAGAVIQGGSVGIAGAALTLVSGGTIAAPTAIALSGMLPSSLTFSTGSDVEGTIDGGGTDSQIALTGTGALTGDISNFGSASALGIAQGADWTASGDWDVANVTNSGTLQAGIPGTPLNLTGNFTEQSTGTMVVVITPSAVSQFNVSGTAALAGKVVYSFAPGTYTPHAVNFLAASGGTTGAFTTVAYAGALTAPAAVPSTQAAASPAAQPAANPLAESPVALAVVSAQLTALAVTQHFSVAPQDASLFAGTAQMSAGQVDAASDVLLRHAAGQSEACISPASALAQAACAHGGWVEATGTALNGSGKAGAGGVMTGVDQVYGPVRLGVALGFDNVSYTDGQGGKASTSTTRVGAYAAVTLGRIDVSAVLSDGIGNNSTHRDSGDGTANAQFSSNVLAGTVQLAAPFSLDGAVFTPAAGLRVTRLSFGRFSESAPQTAFALHGAGGTETLWRPFVSMQVSKNFITARQLIVSPLVSLGYAQSLSSRRFGQTVVAADGTGFNEGVTQEGSAGAVLAGAGLTAGQGNWQVFARYGASLAGAVTSETGQAGVIVRF